MRVGQRNLNKVKLLQPFATAKVTYITTLQLNNKGNIKNSKSNKIIDISL